MQGDFQPNGDPPGRTAAPAAVRDVHSDYLKAAAIIGVVCIHAGLPFHDVFRFGVPVFVGLWAFYIEKALQRRPSAVQRPYLARRLFELAVPYLVWTVFYIALFYRDRISTTPIHTIVGGWFGGFGWSGQYFFIVLFQFVFLMPLLRRWATPRATPPAILAGVAFNVIAEHWLFDNRSIAAVGERLFIYWIPYVFMGIALARGRFRSRRGMAALAVMLLIFAPLETAALDGESKYLAFTVTSASLLLLLATAAADRRATHGPAHSRPLASAAAFIGRNTFAIYVSHVLVLEMLRQSGFTAAATSWGGVFGLVGVVAATVGASLAIGWLLQALRLGILVGKV